MGLQDRDYYNQEVQRLMTGKNKRENSNKNEWKKLENKIKRKTNNVNASDFKGLLWIVLVFIALFFIGNKLVEMKKNGKIVNTDEKTEKHLPPTHSK